MTLIRFYKDLRASMAVPNNIVLLRGQLESVLDFDEQTNEPLGTTLTQFLHKNYGYITTGINRRSDFVSHICRYTYEAIREISQNLRTKIVKEYEFMPIYKVKEFDSVSIDWLAKQQGRNIVEKVLFSPNIKAPTRRFSVDTLENRLFKEFLATLHYILLERNQVPILKNEVCTDICALIEDIFGDEIYSEISEWGDTPPNNTLLNDRNYSKIYKAYCDLLEIDRLIDIDMANEKQNRLRIFAINTASILQEEYGLRLCERPFDVDYMAFEFDSSDKWQGICNSAKFEFFMQEGKFIYAYNGNELKITAQMIGYSADEILNKSFELVKSSVDRLKLQKISALTTEIYKDKSLFIDIFSVQPNINGRALPFLNMRQEWKEQNTSIDLTNAKAFYINDSVNTYSICNAYTDVGLLNRFAYNIKHYIEAHECRPNENIVFVYPDLLTDNEMRPIKRVLKSCYGKIRIIPASIAVVWGKVSKKRDDFKSGDIINAVGYFGQYVYVTMIRLIKSEDVRVEQCGGFILERFPTIKQKLEGDNKLSIILGKNNNGATFDNYSFYCDDYLSYVPNINEDATKKLLLRVKNKYANIAQNSNRIFYVNGQIPQTVFARGMYESAKYANIELSKLWKEHLPELIIEDGVIVSGRYDKFELVGLDGNIDIKDTFTLPMGRDEFYFTLRQGSGAEQITQYIRLKSDILPLNEDTVFNLKLSYEFDEDDVYKLLFIGRNDSSLSINAIFTDKPEVIIDFPYNTESCIFVKNLEAFDDDHMKMLCCNWLEAMINYSNNNFKITNETNGAYWSYYNNNYILVSLDIGSCEEVYNRNGELTGKRVYIDDNYALFVHKDLLEKVKYARVYLAKVQLNKFGDGLILKYVTRFKPSWLSLLTPNDIDDDMKHNIENILLSQNYLDKISVAYLIKDASCIYQENLLNKVIELTLSDKQGYMGVLSTAVQLNQSVIYKINSETANELCKIINKKLNKYINKFDSNTRTINKLCRALELLLNLIRLRETDKTFLYPIDEMAIIFTEQVKRITELNIADKLDSKSFIRAEIPTAFKGNTPTLCFLLYNYLTGKDERVAIEVTVAEEEE